MARSAEDIATELTVALIADKRLATPEQVKAAFDVIYKGIQGTFGH